MGEWDRDTPWRQGHVLSEAQFAELFPKERAAGFDTALVISHDCDLASEIETEAHVELMFAKIVERLQGDYTHSKNSRRLQIPLETSELVLNFELSALDKDRLNKSALANIEPDRQLRLSLEATRTLQHWLSDRYARSSFSEDFNDLLVEKKIREKLPKIVVHFGKIIETIYFDVDDYDEVERNDREPPFELTIYLLYTLEQDADGLARTTEAASKIKELFSQKFYDAKLDRWSGIHLLDCFPISNEAMSVAQHNKLRRWQGDYLSLRARPQLPVARL